MILTRHLLSRPLQVTPASYVSCAADASALISNKAKEITRLNSVYNNLLKNAGVDYIEGKGSLVDAHTVKVGPATGTN